MKKLKDKNLTLYERIEEKEKSRTEQNDKPAFQAFQAFQGDLSLCNNSNNFGTELKAAVFRGRSEGQEPKQDPCPVAVPPMPIVVPDAELISRSLEYLDGINEDLSGWTPWKRQGVTLQDDQIDINSLNSDFTKANLVIRFHSDLLNENFFW